MNKKSHIKTQHLFYETFKYMYMGQFPLNNFINSEYSGPSLSGHLCQQDTSVLRTPMFSPKFVISIHFDLCNQDTSQLRTAVISPKGVLNREVPLDDLCRTSTKFLVV
jgi:hypothetical protein